MAFSQSGNPTLSQKIFNRSLEQTDGSTMTVRGTINKFGFLLFMIVAGAAYTWHLHATNQDSTMMTLMFVGLIGGFVVALVTAFKPNLARYTAPAYGILEGLLLGSISAIINDQFSEKYPNVIMQAVGLTFGVAMAMFLLYNFRIIKPTQRLKSVIYTATAGIAIFYIIDLILFYAFHINIPITDWNNTSVFAVVFSLIVIVVAALRLIMDFDMIEQGSAMGAPKFMEWYGAFGLAVTLIWLYLEILRLLARLNRR